MLQRREFIRKSGKLLGASLLSVQSALGESLHQNQSSNFMQVNKNEEMYWQAIASQFMPSPDFINLENGFYSPMPLPILNAYYEHAKRVNVNSTYYMRHVWDEEKWKLKEFVGQAIGCSPNEFLFTRNTTESLNTTIMGIPLQRNDEVIITNQDYPSALIQWNFRAKYEGIKVVVLDTRNLSSAQIIQLYADKINARTKVLHTTHMIHATGNVMPVKALCQLAREKTIISIVDGAHSFNHLHVKIKEINPDYYMCSLHKWTLNPLGSGLLYIHPSQLKSTKPLFGETSFVEDDIRKMERLGTLEPAVFLTLRDSFAFHHQIGSERKEKRLHFVKNYWMSKVSHLPGIRINTSLNEGESGAIGNFSIDGMKNTEMVEKLFKQYRIHVNTTDDFPVQGVRVTPHLYTSLNQLDLFVEAITNFTKKK